MGEFRYRVDILPKANSDIASYKRAGNKVATARIERILKELELHPETGIGSPKKLKHNYSGCWSRDIDKKNRMTYRIEETKVFVLVLSAKDHYDDK